MHGVVGVAVTVMDTVGVGVDVFVGVGVTVLDGVPVGVLVGVLVGVAVTVGVGVNVFVGVLVGVVGVAVGVLHPLPITTIPRGGAKWNH